jgi:glucose/arabinose dehydrogenase
MEADGSNPEIFAHGVRNTVGFDWHPETGELWFTDNGRDWLGPDRPPDELNRAPTTDMDFGFPYCHGTAIADPEYGKRRSCGDSVPPAMELGPHVAALGIRFYTGTSFPAQYATGSLSPNTVHGIGSPPSVTASPLSPSTATRRSTIRYSPKAG